MDKNLMAYELPNIIGASLHCILYDIDGEYNDVKLLEDWTKTIVDIDDLNSDDLIYFVLSNHKDYFENGGWGHHREDDEHFLATFMPKKKNNDTYIYEDYSYGKHRIYTISFNKETKSQKLIGKKQEMLEKQKYEYENKTVVLNQKTYDELIATIKLMQSKIDHLYSMIGQTNAAIENTKTELTKDIKDNADRTKSDLEHMNYHINRCGNELFPKEEKFEKHYDDDITNMDMYCHPILGHPIEFHDNLSDDHYLTSK